MSVSFANAVAAGLRAHGVAVRLHPGWDRRGNGQVSNYQGMSWHHTATGYGTAPAILISGRSDLAGPLCNSSGDSDGGITIIAAHPANHAGASGGRAMGPLPTTRSFNKLMWGHEIVYPGSKPMTDAQYRSAIILGAVVSKILGRPNADWCRGHMETSITGKWDPGYASGKTYDLNKMRRESTALMTGGGSTPAPAATGTTLRKGDRGSEVRRLQTLLIAKLNDAKYRWSVTEFFGDTTEGAVKAFQSRNGLVADGIVGPKTRAKLGM